MTSKNKLTQPSVSHMLKQALAHHQAGRFTEAETIYLRLLASFPHHFDALHLLGVLAHQTGDNTTAAELINRALQSNSRHPQALNNLGLVYGALKQPVEAEQSFRRAITEKPDFAECYNNLGNILKTSGRLKEAEAAYKHAISHKSDFVVAYSNLGSVLRLLGRLQEAEMACRRAIELHGGAEAYFNLGAVLRGMERLQEAVAAYEQAIAIKPDYADAYNNLGSTLLDLGCLKEAIDAYSRAIEYRPGYAEAYNNLGTAQKARGLLLEAAESYARAVALKPDFAVAYSNLSTVFNELNQPEKAEAAAKTAIELVPSHANAHNNLGTVLKGQGRFQEAVDAYRQALAIQTDHAEALNNLGGVLRELGRHQEAINTWHRCITLNPKYIFAHSNLLLALQSDSAVSVEDIYQQACHFGTVFDRRVPSNTLSNRTDPEKKLRIGYVSGDFRNHPVGYFLARILDCHNRCAVELFCYASGPAEDDLSARLKANAEHWRNLIGLSDEEAKTLILQDKIDILVDLSGHTGMNRLTLFALRAAPVQVTWLGYFGTTGLTSMDYILADRFVVPPEEESFYSEQVWRMPDCYLCFDPPAFDVPTTIAPPVLDTGRITFGCFNSRHKITSDAVALWSSLLRYLPDSRLFLKAKGLADNHECETLLDQFAMHGVAADRLIFEGHSPRHEYLSAYNRIDIALDPFPYGGGTTTAETLWMGAPVVTLRGDRWMGRLSASILSAVGLPECIASSPEEYFAIASALAQDLPRLSNIRERLRTQMERSPFCDGKFFVQNLEAAYRGMWHRWCSSQNHQTQQKQANMTTAVSPP